MQAAGFFVCLFSVLAIFACVQSEPKLFCSGRFGWAKKKSEKYWRAQRARIQYFVCRRYCARFANNPFIFILAPNWIGSFYHMTAHQTSSIVCRFSWHLREFPIRHGSIRSASYVVDVQTLTHVTNSHGRDSIIQSDPIDGKSIFKFSRSSHFPSLVFDDNIWRTRIETHAIGTVSKPNRMETRQKKRERKE